MAVDWMWGWQFDAACRGEDSSLFFAPNYFEKRDQKEGREAKAKALCARCPVREECLEYALQIGWSDGSSSGSGPFAPADPLGLGASAPLRAALCHNLDHGHRGPPRPSGATAAAGPDPRGLVHPRADDRGAGLRVRADPHGGRRDPAPRPPGG